MATQRLTVTDAVEKKLNAIAAKMGGTVSVGFLEGATYPDGTPVAAVAFWDEFGHEGPFRSPPRPFFRNMIAKESPHWPADMAKLAIATGNDGPRVLALMGEEIQGELIKSIAEFDSVPLSPTTLLLRKRFGNHPEDIKIGDVRQAAKDAAKGVAGATGTQAKPLVWTGWLLGHTGYEVRKT